MPGCFRGEIEIRPAAAGEWAEAAAFYAAVGYGGGLADADRVWLAREGRLLVGVVRLCDEEGEVVLRGMHVTALAQRRGVGRRLLEAAVGDLGGRACWCIPYGHLVAFYTQAGFATCAPDAAPEFLQVRLAKYAAQGLDVLIMKREDGAA